MTEDVGRPSIAAGLAALCARWPELAKSRASDEPVFVLAAGSGSGSTLLQRILTTRCFMWSEPLGHSGLVDSLADPLRTLAQMWPETNPSRDVQETQPLVGQVVGLLSPSPRDLFEAHLEFFERLFIEPARQRGAQRWGLNTGRLSADHAAYLRWLFPNAKLLFLHRNPYDAYRSYAARRGAGYDWHYDGPDRPVTARSFGRLWRQLISSFVEEYARLGAVLLRYDELAAGQFAELENYLGFELTQETGKVCLEADGPPPLDTIAGHELEELAHEVGPWADRLGYQCNQQASRQPSQLQALERSADALDPKKCVVLVPVANHLEPECDEALRRLEARGYTVRRVRGYAAIDQGRNQMATDALAEGFEELLWIDSDIEFHPDDVERLRAHGLPIVCGIYPKKGMRAISCHVMPGTEELVFGETGGLVEVRYAATGFLLVHRRVFADMQQQLSLPLCNEKFGRPMLPFFLPLLLPEPTGHWYLAEDYAFSQRARDCGYQIWADTTIRLRHIGTYGFSWEDAGLQLQRFATFHLHLSDSDRKRPSASIRNGAGSAPPPAFEASPQLSELARRNPWPCQRPDVLPNSHGSLHDSTKELLASVLDGETRLVLQLGAWLGQSTRFIAAEAPTAVVLTVDHWRGNPAHQNRPEVQPLLPVLYETFLANCWAYREQIIPLRMTVSEALDEISRRGLEPQVVCLDADRAYEVVRKDLHRIRLLFPDAIVVGGDWDCESVRRAAVDVAREQGGVVGVHGTAWRFFGKPKISQEPPSLLLQTIVSR